MIKNIYIVYMKSIFESDWHESCAFENQLECDSYIKMIKNDPNIICEIEARMVQYWAKGDYERHRIIEEESRENYN